MDALSSFLFRFTVLFFSVLTFRYPDEDVDSRSWRVCALYSIAHRAQTG
jgi:hypothetical protein